MNQRLVTYDVLEVAINAAAKRTVAVITAELDRQMEGLAATVEALGAQVVELGGEVDRTLTGLATAWASPTEEG